jgi:inorganic pyrophosphatase
MKKSVDRLPTGSKDGFVNIVVESPRDSKLKMEFDRKLRAFTVSGPLPLGMSYPFDWGLPGTRAADGDPLDG